MKTEVEEVEEKRHKGREILKIKEI